MVRFCGCGLAGVLSIACCCFELFGGGGVAMVSSFWTIVVNLVFLWIPPVDVVHLVCHSEDLGESFKSLTAIGVGSEVTFWERSFWDYKDDSSVCHHPGGRNVYIRSGKSSTVAKLLSRVDINSGNI
nr:hypothetical protein [Tanacetum cinerariifolium]